MEIGVVLATRFQAGFLQLVSDVVGGLVDALGVDAAALALVGGEEGDVLLEALVDGVFARLGDGSRRGHGQQAEHGQGAPGQAQVAIRHCSLLRWSSNGPPDR